MQPDKMIALLDRALLAHFNVLAHDLEDEAKRVAEQWVALGRAGGQRADHAAALLGNLKPHLAALARFTTTCEQQIDAMIRDPFTEE